jgi:hypothetical protein
MCLDIFVGIVYVLELDNNNNNIKGSGVGASKGKVSA